MANDKNVYVYFSTRNNSNVFRVVFFSDSNDENPEMFDKGWGYFVVKYPSRKHFNRAKKRFNDTGWKNILEYHEDKNVQH